MVFATHQLTDEAVLRPPLPAVKLLLFRR